MYVVTGASGWMGISTLLYLRDELGADLESEVLCFSSVDKTIVLPDGAKVESIALESAPKYAGVYEGIFHYAFLTRDYVKKYGQAAYINANQAILSKMDDFLGQSSYKWTASVSSGAVFDSPNGNLASDVEINPYGYLKLEEEKLLLLLAQECGAASVVGRLWGCTGSTMPVDSKYAISDFILQGLRSREIKVTSDHEVWRRYIDAQDFIRILHSAATEGTSITMDSAGTLIELGELAHKIAEQLGVGVLRPNFDANKKGDFYYPDGLVMQGISERLNVSIQSIEEQIGATIKGHRRQLAQR